jgi:hypothetical protein
VQQRCRLAALQVGPCLIIGGTRMYVSQYCWRSVHTTCERPSVAQRAPCPCSRTRQGVEPWMQLW